MGVIAPFLYIMRTANGRFATRMALLNKTGCSFLPLIVCIKYMQDLSNDFYRLNRFHLWKRYLLLRKS